MKKLLSLLMCGLLLFGCGDKYDDSALRNDLNDLENRVTKLEELCKQMNTNISSLQKIVDALQDNLSISKVEQISDGYIIYFSDGSTATIKNGKDSGDAPVIGVKQDTDGCYYWTLDGEWLTDEKGNKVKAQGTDGKDGVDGEDGNDGTDGEDGITPQLKIENGRWMLSMDDGKTWTDIGQATGADGKDGEDGTDGEDGIDGKDGTNGIFKSVTEDDDNVYFTLEDDSVITIPKSDNSKFAITFDTTDVTILNGGESKTISYTITDATENTVVKAIAQDGWKAKVNTTSADKGTITITAPNPIVESEILVFANDGSYRTVMASLNCAQGQIIIADNSIDISSDGGTKEIKLTTNLDYSVEILDDAKSWLSLASNTRAMREDTITFNIAANEGITRFATVILKEKCGNPLQTIIFKQLGNCTEIQVDTQGTLATLLADYDLEHIKALKIKGEINSEDFLIIRQITNLSLLDISETTLSILPDNCLNNCKITSISLPPTLKIIGAGAFAYSQIKDITIPANVQIIGDQAFRSSSLKSIFFEENSLLQRIGKRAFYSSLIASFTVPSNVETIESEAFSFCQNLLAITFAPNGRLTKIIGGITQDERVFSDSKNLQEINNIPASVKSIYPYAFKDTKLQIIENTEILLHYEDPAGEIYISNPYSTPLTVNIWANWTDWAFPTRFPVAPNLPDISQGDFILALMSMNGLFAYADKASPNTIKLISIDDIIANVQNNDIIDWSDRVILNDFHRVDMPDASIFTIDDLAQSNILDYDNDDDVKTDTYGTITIRNENIEKETELVSLPFSASENATTDGVNCAVVPIYEDNGKGGANYSECSPRILSGRGAFMSGIARCIGVFDPWMKFGGEEGIVKTRYASYQKVVDRLRIITIRAKLTALDLYNLDYTKPVYIAQFGQIFAIYSVETGENDICDCQLLKLKVDGVVAATYYLRLDGKNEDSQWVAEADGINGTAYAITSNGTPYIVDYDSRLYVDLYEEDGDLYLSIYAPENAGTEEINYNPVILGIQENDAVRRQVAVSQKAKSA